MSARQDYFIFTADGKRHATSAASLRSAIRHFKDSPADIVAACEAACVPAAPKEDRPFVAVFLKSPHFEPPEGQVE